MKTALSFALLLCLVQPTFAQDPEFVPLVPKTAEELPNPYRNRPGQSNTLPAAQNTSEPAANTPTKEPEQVLTPGTVDYTKPPRQPLPDWKFDNKGKAALKEYNDAMKKTDEVWKQQVNKLRDAYFNKHNAQLLQLHDKLIAAMKAETQAGNLEEAINLKNAASEIANGSDRSEKKNEKKNEKVEKKSKDQTVKWGGHRYLVVMTPATPSGAEEICAKHGGYLARIDSREEHRFISTLFKFPTDPWIAGSDKAQSGVWAYSDGKPMRYQAWDVGMREPRGGKHAITINTKRGYLYATAPSDEGRPFICEWDE